MVHRSPEASVFLRLFSSEFNGSSASELSWRLDCLGEADADARLVRRDVRWAGSSAVTVPALCPILGCSHGVSAPCFYGSDGVITWLCDRKSGLPVPLLAEHSSPDC